MARAIQKLTARQVATIKEPGRHSDGGGLYLTITPAGSRKWAFIYTRDGKKREMGLGAASDGSVSLADARERAEAARKALASGADPLREKRAVKRADVAIPTFGEVSDAYIDEHAPGFRNEKHLAQWKMTMREYAKKLRALPVNEVTTEDVLSVLKPLWQAKPETAKRTQGRIERILDAAKAMNHRTGENPARWRGHLDKLLPKQGKLTRGHHAALPYGSVAELVTKLRGSKAVSAKALEFIILTAARSGEALGATWSEVDLDAKVWSVPAARMKAGRAHRVPLTARAAQLLAEVRSMSDGTNPFVFPSNHAGKAVSATALTKALDSRVEVHCTVHGFRSAFRDWVSEETQYPREVAEAALAHVVGDATERAYRRGDALEKRRQLMEAWGAFCSPKAASNVVDLLAARA